ncbi:hypothetical protein BPC006_I2035 [Burkholderia pseudomallei BPC006]|nr:hypothetical protein BPC006_I2035 [Burkholderia pseudomallei BPC006]
MMPPWRAAAARSRHPSVAAADGRRSSRSRPCASRGAAIAVAADATATADAATPLRRR